MTEPRLSWAAIIVTRNRPEALALSLPLLLAQTRPPAEIIVADSSDDPEPNRRLAAEAAARAPFPVRHVVAPPGMTVQRNFALKRTGGDVVFFPDDDSLAHPDALERMMAIYERDEAGLIGGVAAAETLTPPPGAFSGAAGGGYAMKGSDRLRALIARRRVQIEDRLFPDPMKLAARRLQRRLPPPPAWLAEERAEPVEWMTGFRMSFRRKSIEARGFNEKLGRYALFEDVDAGFGVMRERWIVTTRNAEIYHHKAPDRRANGRQLGAIQILNRAYVARRGGCSDPGIVLAARWHGALRIAQLAAGAGSGFGRARLAGAAAAWARIGEMFAATDDALDETYLRLRRAIFGDEA